MPWKRMLAYVTGEIEESLLLRIEYLIEENRILRDQIEKRILLTDAERKTLAERAVALGKLMADTVTIVKPETILRWHRRLVAQKFDGSEFRKRHGRPRVPPEVEELVVRMAKDNPSWGYDRIAGAVRNLGHKVSDQTVGNILKRNGIAPSPERRKNTTWAEFIRRHKEVLWACDFFTTEIWTKLGLTAEIGGGAFFRLPKNRCDVSFQRAAENRMSLCPDGAWSNGKPGRRGRELRLRKSPAKYAYDPITHARLDFLRGSGGQVAQPPRPQRVAPDKPSDHPPTTPCPPPDPVGPGLGCRLPAIP